MLKKHLLFLSGLLLLTNVFAQAPRSYSASELLLQLKKLNTTGSVLYIAAHPDDENTRLLAYLANEKCFRTGYLSLTRGDGGQNLIGSEQGVELGLIRTQELLAARRVDGAEQFFTRAYDFGFSKTPVETFRKWNHDSVLADVVWVIRNFRPDVIITRFATDGSGGHGHHTASAILAEEAFEAAADPNRFPEQLNYVSVWKARRIFHNSTARFFNPNADLSSLIKTDVGVYNALLGKSYGEIAAESRSMHKSQGFGSAKQRGEAYEYFKPLRGDTTGLKGLFDGMDMSWKRVPDAAKIEKEIVAVIAAYKPENPSLSVPALVQLHVLINNALQHNNDNKILYAYKLSQLNELILGCAGLYSEAVAPAAQAQSPVGFKSLSTLRSHQQASIPGNLPSAFRPLPYDVTDTVSRQLNGQSQISQPYWLNRMPENGMFQVNDQLLIGKPEQPLSTDLFYRFGSEEFSVSRRIQYKWTDPEKGELYKPVVVMPPVVIRMHTPLQVFSGNGAKKVSLSVKAYKDSTRFTLDLQVPQGWKLTLTGSDSAADQASRKPGDNVSEYRLRVADNFIARKGEEKTFNIWVIPPAQAGTGRLQAAAVVNGVAYTKGIREISYDHIPAQTYFPDEETRLVRLDINRKAKRIGYIPGAGDEVATCLTQLGYEVTVLTDHMLATEPLGQFDAIVTGVRAFNTNENLANYKARLLDYVNAGGNLVVQYNTNSFAGPMKAEMGPFPFKITRDRVTDEDAAVSFDLPQHPVLNTPNKITEKDFEGWVQERCIYSAGDVDAHYELPISMSDPGEKPNKTALLIANHGKGHFVYTGIVFFRELPAGVPGAYRLFTNILELGK